MMEEIAEQRIQEALRRGDLDDLPGRGRRLELDDDSMVPPALRPAYRILRNAGFVPPELATRREIRVLEDLLAAVRPEDAESAETARARKRLMLLRARLEGSERRVSGIARSPEYRGRLISRLGAGG